MTTIAPLDPEPLFEAGRFDEALAGWRTVADREPASPRAAARVGACLLALARYEEAEGVLGPLAEAMPEQPLLAYRLAVARAGLGHIDAALDGLAAAAASGLRLACGLDAEPALAAVRAAPRYAAIRSQVVRNGARTADDPPFRTFDFWVGTWEARTADGILQGHNRIELVLGGAAIVERWTGVAGYRGTSLNRYDRRTDTWRQTWVDDQGDIVEFENGTARDGRLVFGAVDADGGRRRLTFEDRGPDAFRQLSERSDDGGRTWTVEYDFSYRRIPDGEMPEPEPVPG